VAHFKLFFKTSGLLLRQHTMLSIWLLLVAVEDHHLVAVQGATGPLQDLL
jgi:hypothetical protein